MAILLNLVKSSTQCSVQPRTLACVDYHYPGEQIREQRSVEQRNEANVLGDLINPFG